MRISIDLVPPKEGYFISVDVSDKEIICFNNTHGDNDIRKKVMIGERYSNEEPTDRWVTMVVVDGELKEKKEVEWIEEENIDIVDNEAWKTVEKMDMPREIHDKLSDLSSRIFMNREDPDSIKGELKELDEFLSEKMDQVMESFSE